MRRDLRGNTIEPTAPIRVSAKPPTTPAMPPSRPAPPPVPATVHTSVLRHCLTEEIRDGLLIGLVPDELANVAADRVGELVDRLAVSAAWVQQLVAGLGSEDIDALAMYAQYLTSDEKAP